MQDSGLHYGIQLVQFWIVVYYKVVVVVTCMDATLLIAVSLHGSAGMNNDISVLQVLVIA